MNNLILVPKQPVIFELDLKQQYLTKPSVETSLSDITCIDNVGSNSNVIVHANSNSSTLKTITTTNQLQSDLTLEEESAPSNTLNIGITPHHSNNYSEDNDIQYSNDKYMVIDFNVVNNNNNILNNNASSPSPPPPPTIPNEISGSHPDIHYKSMTEVELSAIPNDENETDVESKSWSCTKYAKITRKSTILLRATSRSRSRTFSISRKKITINVFVYIQ